MAWRDMRCRVNRWTEWCSPKIHVHLEPQNVTLFGNNVLADVFKVRIDMRSYWIQVGPKSNERLLIRDRKGHREEGNMKMEAETGVIHL